MQFIFNSHLKYSANYKAKQRAIGTFKNALTAYLIANLNGGFDCLMKTTTSFVNTFLIEVDAARHFYSVLFID